MIFFKKKNPNEVNLKTPVRRLVFTVFFSMFVLTAYFLATSRFYSLLGVFNTAAMQAESQARQAAVLIDKQALSDLIEKYRKDSSAAKADSFYARTSAILQTLKPLKGIDFSKGKKFTCKIYLCTNDTLDNDYRIIASSDTALKFGAKFHAEKKDNDTKGEIKINRSNTNESINFDDFEQEVKDIKGHSIARIFVRPSSTFLEGQMVDSLKSGLKVSLIIFFITFLLIFFSLRKLVKKEQKIKVSLHESKQLVEHKNREITDSINYAKRIQSAILPDIEHIYRTLKNAFVLYKPKDVVSGDFYVFIEKDELVFLAAVDCTGHGVPGAFMSMIGHNLLTEIIVERGISQPADILGHLNREVRKALRQDNNDTKDGMDIAIVTINTVEQSLQYAGANRPLWVIKQGVQTIDSIQVTTPTKASIGGHTNATQVYANHEIKLEKGDSIYIFTDGYADQFGGPDEKKFMTKRLKETLISIQNKDMVEQAKRWIRLSGTGSIQMSRWTMCW